MNKSAFLLIPHMNIYLLGQGWGWLNRTPQFNSNTNVYINLYIILNPKRMHGYVLLQKKEKK